MRVLYFVLATALAASLSLAGEEGQSKSGPKPWWLAEPGAAAKDREAPKAGQPAPEKTVEPARNDREMPPSREAIREKIEAKRGEGQPGGRRQPQLQQKAPEDQPRVASRPTPRERLVCRLANAPALDVVQTVNELIKNERAVQGPGAPDGTVVLAEPVTNSVIVSGEPERVHEVLRLVEQLDRTPRMVSVDVVIAAVKLPEGKTLLEGDQLGPRVTATREEVAKLVEKLVKTEGVEILARPSIMALDNQPAFIQIGERVPRPVLRNTKEGPVFDVQLENVGLIVGVTARTSPDGAVTMEIDVEKSQLAAQGEGVPVGADREGNVIRSPRIRVLTAQTTVRVPSGEAALVGGLATKEGDQTVQLLVIVTPQVVETKK